MCCWRFNRDEGLPSLLSSRTRRVLDGEVMTALDRFRLAVEPTTSRAS